MQNLLGTMFSGSGFGQRIFLDSQAGPKFSQKLYRDSCSAPGLGQRLVQDPHPAGLTSSQRLVQDSCSGLWRDVGSSPIFHIISRNSFGHRPILGRGCWASSVGPLNLPREGKQIRTYV